MRQKIRSSWPAMLAKTMASSALTTAAAAVACRDGTRLVDQVLRGAGVLMQSAFSRMVSRDAFSGWACTCTWRRLADWLACFSRPSRLTACIINDSDSKDKSSKQQWVSSHAYTSVLQSRIPLSETARNEIRSTLLHRSSCTNASFLAFHSFAHPHHDQRQTIWEDSRKQYQYLDVTAIIWEVKPW
mmetsp:Transcript_26581/g.74355  ORF Transcript_26581/g.74355 Transcript_26581/m.74355 type:complete len:186 (-) Transcript_26581:488-1045(-)